ncbi:MAG TPA: YggS family pyridoxal phosphate-dependent enzyme [Chloroflexi bacterium]|nr:YggS family pyridoxal phosphate-dependent enzyme [Chloroflexota bacterium]HHW85006.1 YggS family pyridoxal phosphate-dependent enzyme [Chloroflexota bacterium]
MILNPERAAEIAANLAEVRRRMAAAAERSGRDPAAVRLVAVSKTYPLADIAAAYVAGQRDFGENRLEELWPKVAAAKVQGLDVIRWHMIGTLQSRKTRDAVGPLALIHAVDRVKIAQRLSRDAQAAGCVLDVLLEVNVSGEASKHGFTPSEVLAVAAELLALPGIRICGLMTMAPYEAVPEATRPVFRALRQLRDALALRFPAGDWRELSMGMTNDFEIAIEEGATIVRIGSAIFGVRNG